MKTTKMLGGLCNSWRSALPNDLKVIAALALSAAAMLPIAAEAVNFPEADGSHDIASSTAWGGVLPTTETEVAITGNASFITGTNHIVDGGRLCMYQPYVPPTSISQLKSN